VTTGSEAMPPRRTFPIAGDSVVRYTLHERLNHWLAALSYVYLLMSGLALYSPYLYWMATVLGGGPSVRFWHPWVGLVFFAVVLWMDRMWRRDMRITEADRRWTRDLRKYIENRDEELPPVARFNPGQKQFFWVMLVGAVVLLFTGIIMWIPEYIPASLSLVRSLAILLHVAAALVTIGAFIIHVYMGVFVVPGGLRAIVHGNVSADWARAHHPLWHQQVTQKHAARD
jgi:formate dehydrogenase subunit gamma